MLFVSNIENVCGFSFLFNWISTWFHRNKESRGRGKKMKTNSKLDLWGTGEGYLPRNSGPGTYRFRTQLSIFRGGGHLLHHLKGSVKVAWSPQQRHVMVHSPQPLLQFHLACGQKEQGSKLSQALPPCLRPKWVCIRLAALEMKKDHFTSIPRASAHPATWWHFRWMMQHVVNFTACVF